MGIMPMPPFVLPPVGPPLPEAPKLKLLLLVEAACFFEAPELALPLPRPENFLEPLAFLYPPRVVFV